MLNPINQITIGCESNQNYFKTNELLYKILLPILEEKWLIPIIIDYSQPSELILFESLLLTDCNNIIFCNDSNSVIIEKKIVDSYEGFDYLIAYYKYTFNISSNIRSNTTNLVIKDIKDDIEKMNNNKGQLENTNIIIKHMENSNLVQFELIHYYSDHNRVDYEFDNEYTDLLTIDIINDNISQETVNHLLSLKKYTECISLELNYDSDKKYIFVTNSNNTIYLLNCNQKSLHLLLNNEQVTKDTDIKISTKQINIICYSYENYLIAIYDVDNLICIVDIQNKEKHFYINVRDELNTLFENNSTKNISLKNLTFVTKSDTINTIHNTTRYTTLQYRSYNDYFILHIDILTKKIRKLKISNLLTSIYTVSHNCCIGLTKDGKIMKYNL